MSKINVALEGRTYEIEFDYLPNQPEIAVKVNGQLLKVYVPDKPIEKMDWLMIDDVPEEFILETNMHWIHGEYGLHRLEVHDLESSVARPHSGDGRIKAPIPGLITRILVNVGDKVETGQTVVVLEAMKMENELRATRAGTISTLNVHTGQSVIRDEVLVEIS
jgi:acetyl/propionyl-CoA carboxylase alpha subunit